MSTFLSTFLQQLLNGLMLGSQYSLLAIGYSLVFGILNLFNIAHGETFMFSMFIAAALLILFQAPLWVAFLVAALAGGVIGLLINQLSFRPIKPEYHLAPVLSTIGFGMILTHVAILIWTSEGTTVPPTVEVAEIHLGPVLISSVQVLVLGLSLAVMLAVEYFIQGTRMGGAIRAIAESPSTAELLGVNVPRVIALTFVVSGALAGIAGILISLRLGIIKPSLGFTFGLKALAVMFIGGQGNVRGAMLAGLVVGTAEILAMAYGSAFYSDAVVWGLFILILLFRPSGLFGSQIRTAS
ncbi:MAG: branched-chain amino acid ABC transporter permease [Dehalococcoidia bacterium]|nr:branched-chain amino acid ABC transporter permease [Dehalococcoidia bacterium]